jgi:restriction system protein
MAIPNFQDAMLPILKFCADEDVQHWRVLRDHCAELFQATDEELVELLDSGGSRFDSRVQWAITHLVQAGLLDRPRRSHVRITHRGKDVLSNNPARVDMQLLSQFAEYQDFRTRTKGGKQSKVVDRNDTSESVEQHPLESIAEAVRANNTALADELLRRILAEEPSFLERLVLKLLSAMGYGGRAGVAEHWGRPGDGGIDGVVRQDVLGLDRVYIQAKRYTDRPVERPDIQAFVGALHGVQADRGVFITTSRFSNGAMEYADRVPQRIVLIDGHRLTELMILHNVGVQDESIFVLKKIDEDFFDQP